jgi:hypothetical protein
MADGSLILFKFCLHSPSFQLSGLQAAVNFALMMSQMEGGCPVDYNTITDLFLQVLLFYYF